MALNPAYKPIDFTTPATATFFGRLGSDIRWTDPPAATFDPGRSKWLTPRHVQAAAIVQHMYAGALRARSVSLEAYANKMGVSRPHINRFVRGQAILRLDDIAVIAYCDPQMLPSRPEIRDAFRAHAQAVEDERTTRDLAQRGTREQIRRFQQRLDAREFAMAASDDAVDDPSEPPEPVDRTREILNAARRPLRESVRRLRARTAELLQWQAFDPKQKIECSLSIGGPLRADGAPCEDFPSDIACVLHTDWLEMVGKPWARIGDHFILDVLEYQPGGVDTAPKRVIALNIVHVGAFDIRFRPSAADVERVGRNELRLHFDDPFIADVPLEKIRAALQGADDVDEVMANYEAALASDPSLTRSYP